MYIAIIGDIVDSRKIKNRDDIQKKLLSILKEINIDFKNNIAAKFLITLGDEFQGLLNDANNLLKIIDTIKFKMYPIKIRFGVGIGSIDTNINSEMALGADGPAFHYARAMVEKIRKINKIKSKSLINTDIILDANNNDNVINLINDNLSLCYELEEKWTDKQRLLIEEMLFTNKTQRELAEEFKIAQSSVQRRLKTSGYYNYINAKRNISNILEEQWENKYAD